MDSGYGCCAPRRSGTGSACEARKRLRWKTPCCGRRPEHAQRKTMSTTSAIRRFGRSAARLSRTRYPAFLFGGGMPSDQLPVFTYHAVGAAALRGDLEFLERNGYRTIGIEEFHDRCTSRGGTGDRCVLLTFDDGLRNFRDEVYPLLREHEARAVAFVPTYWIDGGERLPACDGEHSEAAARARADAAENPGFMTWQEL